MQLKMHVCVQFSTLFEIPSFRFISFSFVALLSSSFRSTCLQIIKRTISHIWMSKIQFMYTLSCYCELTPFCRLLEYSQCESCIRLALCGNNFALHSDSSSMRIASANEPRVIWFYTNRDIKPITKCSSAPRYTFDSFIRLLSFDRAVSLWQSCGLNPNERHTLKWWRWK